MLKLSNKQVYENNPPRVLIIPESHPDLKHIVSNK